MALAIVIGESVNRDPYLDQTYATVEEAAEKLTVSPSRIYKLVAMGRLDAVEFGRCKLIRRESLDAFERIPAGWKKGRPRKVS